MTDFIAPEAQILIVDDNETNLRIALGLLRPLGMQMDIADNGKMALRMIEEKHYHLIFMDHMMPEMDGVEVVTQLRQMEGDYFKRVPVIALTANSSAFSKELLLQIGINDLLEKPIEMQMICAKIRCWLPPGLLQDQVSQHASKILPPSSATHNTELPVIEGIDTLAGLRHSKSEKLFIELLGNFYKLIDMKADRIERYLSLGLMREITVEVHALKAAAQAIGATELSEAFGRLERYGRTQNIEDLALETPGVLRRYRGMKHALAPFGEVTVLEKKAGTKPELLLLLGMLISAMSHLDLDHTDTIMMQLENKCVPREYRVQIEVLRAYIADVDVEKATYVAQSLICAIENS